MPAAIALGDVTPTLAAFDFRYSGGIHIEARSKLISFDAACKERLDLFYLIFGQFCLTVFLTAKNLFGVNAQPVSVAARDSFGVLSHPVPLSSVDPVGIFAHRIAITKGRKPVGRSMAHILPVSKVFKIVGAVIRFAAIFVIDDSVSRSAANKGFGDESMDSPTPKRFTTIKSDAQIAVPVGRLLEQHRAASKVRSVVASHAPKITDLIKRLMVANGKPGLILKLFGGKLSLNFFAHIVGVLTLYACSYPLNIPHTSKEVALCPLP